MVLQKPSRCSYGPQKLYEGPRFGYEVDTRLISILLNYYQILTRCEAGEPSKPRTIKGAKEIGSFLDDVYSRDMKHTLDHGIVDGKHLAFVEGCSYPDGTHVIASTMAELGPNGIVKQMTVQAWDS